MIEIQKWLLQICLACILISVLSSFIKNEKVNSSIKSVLALYILVITLNSISSTNFSLEESDYTQNYKPVGSINADQLVLDSASQAVCNQINERFAQEDLNTTCKAVVLNIDDSNSITLQNPNESSIKIVKEVLGNKITVITEKEG